MVRIDLECRFVERVDVVWFDLVWFDLVGINLVGINLVRVDLVRRLLDGFDLVGFDLVSQQLDRQHVVWIQLDRTHLGPRKTDPMRYEVERTAGSIRRHPS